MEALGLIETKGMIGAIEAADGRLRDVTGFLEPAAA